MVGEHCKVLIVDDELLIRQGVINYIDWESKGFEIIGGASNGKEALEMIEKFKPHVIITDVVMPVMDGIELVKRVKERFPEIEIIVLSSFEDYEYVRSTFQSGVSDYILKPKLSHEKLLSTIKRAVMNIPNFQLPNKPIKKELSINEIITMLLNGDKIGNKEKQILSQLKYGEFVLMKIVSKYGSVEIDEIKSKLKIDFNRVESYVLETKKHSSIILLNCHESYLKVLKNELQEISSHQEKDPVFQIIICFFDEIYQIKKVYHDEILTMEKYLFYLPLEPVIRQGRLPKIEKSDRPFDLNYFTEIFKSHQFNLAINYALDHIKYLSTQYHRDEFEFKSFIGNIIFNMIVLIDNLNYDSELLEEKKYNYFSNINEAKNVHEAIKLFNDFIFKVKEIVFEIHQGDGPSQIEQMLQYIEENYKEPLSLTQIAEHFHFNPSYLSAYFSNHHNEGFNEYLNRLRIYKSMKLLNNSTLPISDISGLVGYSGHSYYCKVFKKITGMSPSEYRRVHQV